MIIIGIDPGLSGAVAILDTRANYFTVHDMPVFELKRNGKAKREVNGPELARLVSEAGADIAVVEAVGAMPGQGVSSVFAFGKGFGIALGVLAGRIRTEMVPPATWKKAMGLSGLGKDASRAIVTKLYPSEAKQFARVKDDGRAEAVLIALYGAKHFTF